MTWAKQEAAYGTESARIAQLQYKAGVKTIYDVLQAQQAAQSALNDDVAARVNYVDAVVKLRVSLGTFTRTKRRRRSLKRYEAGSKSRRSHPRTVAHRWPDRHLERGHTKTPVTVQRVTLTTFMEKLPESGVLQRPQTETIPALVAGNIAQLYARAGQSVSAGELLAIVYNPALEYSAAGSRADYVSASANVDLARIQERNAKVGYQGQVETAKSNCDEAQRIYDADAQLYKNQAIPRQQLDQDKAKLDQARVTYDQAVAQLKLGAVTSYSGDSIQYAAAAAQKARIINDQNQQQLGIFAHRRAFRRRHSNSRAADERPAAAQFRPATPLRRANRSLPSRSASTFIVRTKVDEQDIARVAVGQGAIVSGEDFSGATFPGRVVTIAPTAQKSDDPSATTKQVLTDIALERIASFMKDGMSADVDILTTSCTTSWSFRTARLLRARKARSTSGSSRPEQHRSEPLQSARATKRPASCAADCDRANRSCLRRRRR